MLNTLKKNIIEAGETIKEGFSKPKEVTIKTTEIDLVTEYDVNVEEFLKTKFKENFPDFIFIGEESDNLEEYINNKDLKNYFIVDPIDGTTNFIKGFPYVSISVAVYKDNKPYLGIVYNPIMNEFYHSFAGSNESFLNEKKIKVSKKEPGVLINATYQSHKKQNPKQEEIDIINDLESTYLEKRVLHSAALEMCYVAKGVFGVYATNHIKPWDIAAAKIILEGAGGIVKDLFNKELNVLKVETIKAFSK